MIIKMRKVMIKIYGCRFLFGGIIQENFLIKLLFSLTKDIILGISFGFY